MRYYRLARTSGPLPDGYPLRVGTIIRTTKRHYRKTGYVFNPVTLDWVSLHWIECDEPAGGAS